MPAAPALRDVFNAYRAAFGEEDDGLVFEDARSPLIRLDVLVYRPGEHSDMTVFVTIGMAAAELPAAPGPGGGGRAELRFSRRGRVTRDAERAIAAQLANLAAHPFVTGEQVNWGHILGLGGDFPTFPGCRAIFISGPLSPDGLDYIRTSTGPVRVLNIVPITVDERVLGRTLAPIRFIETIMQRVDIYAERPDATPPRR